MTLIDANNIIIVIIIIIFYGFCFAILSLNTLEGWFLNSKTSIEIYIHVTTINAKTKKKL